MIKAINRFFTRKKPMEVKQSDNRPRFLSWYAAASVGGNDLQAGVALRLATSTSIVTTAIDMIVNEFGSLQLQVVDRTTGAVFRSHPVLDLLTKPNPAVVSGKLFLMEMASFYLITGNSYLIATGAVRKPPLELFNIFPQTVIIQQNDKDSFAQSYQVTNTTGSMKYVRQSRGTPGGQFRYYDGELRELRQFRRFIARQGCLYGISPLDAIYPEIELFNLSTTHNISLLRRGARPSGIVMFSGSENGQTEGLTDDQYARLKEQFNDMYVGAENAGGVLIAEGPDGVHYQDMMTSNRDMDFTNLKKSTEQQINNRLGIPLPLVTTSTQTFDNLRQSRELLYDNTILSLADLLLDDLSMFLMPRYPDSSNLRITYNESAIRALRTRSIRELLDRTKAGIYSVNELRTQDGAESIGDDGDTIYIPNNVVPLGDDIFVADQDRPK